LEWRCRMMPCCPRGLRSVPEALPSGEGQATAIERVVEGWLLQYAGRSESTARRYLQAWNDVQGLLHRYGGIGAIGPDEAAEIYWELVHAKSPATANVTASAMTQLWDRLAERGLVRDNPWAGLKRATPKDTTAERILTEEEVGALFKAAAPGLEKLLVSFLYYTGCRVSEAVSCRWRDVHPDPGGYAVTVYGKGGKTRSVHLPDHLYGMLKRSAVRTGPDDYLIADDEGRPLSRFDARRILRRIARRADLDKRVSPHWLRHSHASHALDRGAPPHEVQATLGHSSLATTTKYLHVRPGRGSGDVLPTFPEGDS